MAGLTCPLGVLWLFECEDPVYVCRTQQHLCLLISSDSAEKKTTMTKQSGFTQMWTILRECASPPHPRFIDFPTEGNLCNQRSHLSSLAQIFTLHRERGFYGERGNKV